MVNVVPSQNGKFLFFEGFVPIRCGITTTAFGDCNSYQLLQKNIHVKKRFYEIKEIVKANCYFRVMPEHSNNVFVAAENGNQENFPKCDAIIYDPRDFRDNIKPVALIPTGDCPIIIITDGKTIGLVHSGHKGTKLNIAKLMIKKFTQFFDAKPQNIKAIIWPGICGDCYQVGEEFYEIFPGYVYPFANGHHIYLAEVIRDQLLNCGILRHHIAVLKNFCSYHYQQNGNHTFYSARRQNKGGNIVFAAPL